MEYLRIKLPSEETWRRYVIIWDAHYRGHTLSAIGSRYGLTKGRVWQICQKVDNILEVPHNFRKLARKR